MIFFRHRRRKRSKRLAARSRPDDDVHDPNFVEYVWLPITGIGLVVLAISGLAGAGSSLLGTAFQMLYALACLALFALTTSFLAGGARNSIRDSHLNGHIYRRQTFKQVIGEVLLGLAVGLWAYAPSVIVPALVFRAAWLGYLMLLIEVIILAYGVYRVARWLRYHRAG